MSSQVSTHAKPPSRGISLRECVGLGALWSHDLIRHCSHVEPNRADDLKWDGVLEGAFGGEDDEGFAIGEGVLVSSSSLVKSIKSYVQGNFLGGMIVSLIFFEGLDEEAWVDAMDVLRFEENEEDDDEE
nr:hypothetical protein [Tanacetum cinerariifolium]